MPEMSLLIALVLAQAAPRNAERTAPPDADARRQRLAALLLRDRAKKGLGPRFDIRGFHDEVLGGGAMPLDVPEKRIAAWTAEGRQGGARGAALH